MQKFNDLPWHDTEIKQILIDRSDPGHKDEIRLLICWPDSEKNDWIIFADCYKFESNFNFGIVADETILEACCLDDTPRLKEIKMVWGNMGVDLKKLKHYKIVLNSTASEMNIYASNFYIQK